MGLDQSLYKNKDLKEEILYFRKFHTLHSKIEQVLGEVLENGKTYRLNKEDLIQVSDYIAKEGLLEYWVWDDDHIDNFYKALGALSYYISKDKPLYYNADW